MPKCGAAHPEDASRICWKTDTTHGEHCDPQGPPWPNPEGREQAAALKAGKKGSVAKDFVTMVGQGSKGYVDRKREEAEKAKGRPVSLDPPPEAVAAWTKEAWHTHALALFREYLRYHPEPFTTAEDIWPLLPKPPEMRAMVLVVRALTRSKCMEEVSAKRLKGVYHTRDGHEFAENKLVPVYRSTMAQVPSSISEGA